MRLSQNDLGLLANLVAEALEVRRERQRLGREVELEIALLGDMLERIQREVVELSELGFSTGSDEALG